MILYICVCVCVYSALEMRPSDFSFKKSIMFCLKRSFPILSYFI